MYLALARMLAPWPFTAIRIAGSGLALSIPASTASSVLLPRPARHQGFGNILSFDNVCQGGFEGYRLYGDDRGKDEEAGSKMRGGYM